MGWFAVYVDEPELPALTLNIVAITQDFVVAGSDRRLTFPDGSVCTERSIKMTYFECFDARGFIVYNGIGRDDSLQTPCDWMQEDLDLPRLNFDNFILRLKKIGDAKLNSAVSSMPDKRHTFLIGGYLRNFGADMLPFVRMISNYETATDEIIETTPKSELQITGLIADTPFVPCRGIISTGSTGGMRQRVATLGTGLKAGMTAPKVAAKVGKFIKDASFSKGRGGTIGSTADIGIIYRNGGVNLAGSPIGGALLQEMPNILTPTMRMGSIYQEQGPGIIGSSRYDSTTGRTKIQELNCEKCGNPVPERQRECGKCGHIFQNINLPMKGQGAKEIRFGARIMITKPLGG